VAVLLSAVQPAGPAGCNIWLVLQPAAERALQDAVQKHLCAAKGASMPSKAPTLQALFVQLGLAADELAILRFIRQHRPMPPDVDMLHARFWTPSQAAVLWRLRRRGPHWVEVLDQLEAALRGHHGQQQESA